MASSRASTSAGRRRTRAKSAHRERAAGRKAPTKSPSKNAAPKPKRPPRTKAAKAKPKAPSRSKAAKAKPKPPPKPKAARTKPKPRAKSAKRAPRASLPRTLTIALFAGTAALALAAAYLFWFRDSSLVIVEKVTVEGIEGPEAEAVTAALTRAGQKMTTLNVDEGELAAAVSGFPTVVAVEAEPDFPHALTVEVTPRPPVLSVSDGGPPVAVAADGTVLHGVETAEDALPGLDVDAVPAKGRLTGEPLALAEVAGAAPDPLLPLIDELSFSDDGIEVVLKGEIPVKFGDADDAEAKWAGVAAILANPQVKTLTYLDVRVPERPSVGGAAPPPEAESAPLTPE